MSASGTDKSILPWSPRELALAAVMLCAGVAAMWSSWRDWAEISYQIEEHSHVFLVVPFAAAIVWMNRERFREVRAGASWVGPAVVAAGWALASYGFHDAHQSLWHFGAVLVVVGAVVTVLGHGVLIKFWPAFLMLVLIVPAPNGIRLAIATPLQAKTAAIVERVLTFFGEPVGRQGNSLTINGEAVLIAEACNGLRMVFPLLLVCWLFAFITPLRNWVRWAIILLSPLVALVCNVIRLLPTVLMFGYADRGLATKFHDWGGWPMILVAFLLLMLGVKLVESLGFEVRQAERKGDEAGGPLPAVSCS